MSGSGTALSHHDRRRWEWLALLGVSLVAVILGWVGFLDYDGVTGRGWARHVRAAYETVQLFVLHAPHFEKPVQLKLYLACYLAAGASLWTVGGALWRVYAVEFHQLRLGFLKDHVVVCGAGSRGVALVRDFVSRGPGRRPQTVVVIEKDANAPGLRICEDLGVPCLVADASERGTLRTAGVASAGSLVVTCAGDGLNLNIALGARQIVEASRTGGGPLRCYVQLENPFLRAQARQNNLIATAGGRFELSTVGLDLHENSARQLFSNNPLDWGPIAEDSPVRVLLVIFGLGRMGESVLLQAARTGHFANRLRMRVVVVDREAGAREAGLRERYPRLSEICELEFHSRDANDPTLAAWADQLACGEGFMPTLVAALPSDTLNLALALRLGRSEGIRAKGCPIRARMSSRHGAAELVSDPGQREMVGGRVTLFGMLEDACNRETLQESRLDTLARGIHEDYARHAPKRAGTPGNPSKVDSWEELTEDFKGSNRAAADHIEVKLRAAGLHSVRQGEPGEPVEGFSREQVEVLARMEHERYCAQRWLDGWNYAPGNSNAAAKTNPTLVPWEKLSEDQRDKDREQVRNIPRVLASVGLSIRR